MAVFSAMLLVTIFSSLLTGSLCAPGPFLSSGALPSSSADVFQQLNANISQMIKNAFRDALADAGNFTEILKTKLSACLDGNNTECNLVNLYLVEQQRNTTVSSVGATSTTATTPKPAGMLSTLWMNSTTISTSTMSPMTTNSTSTSIRTTLGPNVTSTTLQTWPVTTNLMNSSSILGSNSSINNYSITPLPVFTTAANASTTRNGTLLPTTSPPIASSSNITLFTSTISPASTPMTSSSTPATPTSSTTRNSTVLPTGTPSSSLFGINSTSSNSTLNSTQSLPSTTMAPNSIINSTISTFNSTPVTLVSSTTRNGTVAMSTPLPSASTTSYVNNNSSLSTTMSLPGISTTLNATTTTKSPIVTPSGNLQPFNVSVPSPLLAMNSSLSLVTFAQSNGTSPVSSLNATTVRPITTSISTVAGGNNNFFTAASGNVSNQTITVPFISSLSNITGIPVTLPWMNGTATPITLPNSIFFLTNVSTTSSTSPSLNATTSRPPAAGNSSASTPMLITQPFGSATAIPVAQNSSMSMPGIGTSVPRSDQSTTTGTSQPTTSTTQRPTSTNPTTTPATTKSPDAMSGNLIQLPSLETVIPRIVQVFDFIRQLSAIDKVFNNRQRILPGLKSSRLEQWESSYPGNEYTGWGYQQQGQWMLPPACDCYEAFHGSSVNSYTKSKKDLAFSSCLAQLDSKRSKIGYSPRKRPNQRSRAPRQANWIQQQNEGNQHTCYGKVSRFLQDYEAKKIWLHSLGQDESIELIKCYGQHMSWLDKNDEADPTALVAWIEDSSLRSLTLKRSLVTAASVDCAWLTSDLTAYLECIWQPCFAT